jgi:hypothetical protein
MEVVRATHIIYTSVLPLNDDTAIAKKRQKKVCILPEAKNME